jgi:hypothetical protein
MFRFTIKRTGVLFSSKYVGFYISIRTIVDDIMEPVLKTVKGVYYISFWGLVFYLRIRKLNLKEKPNESAPL